MFDRPASGLLTARSLLLSWVVGNTFASFHIARDFVLATTGHVSPAVVAATVPNHRPSKVCLAQADRSPAGLRRWHGCQCIL